MSIPTKTVVTECPIDGLEKDIEDECEGCEYEGYANAVEYFCQHPTIREEDEEEEE